MITSKMAEGSGEEHLEEVLDLAKTKITAKVKELQEECIEIRKRISGNFRCCYLYNVIVDVAVNFFLQLS